MDKTITNKAIFLDRDGVLIRDTHLITTWEQVEILEGVKQAVGLLKDMGYLLFILSNQSVVARGMLSRIECEDLHQRILDEIGIREKIEESYLCPYHPDAQIEKYRKEHPWRKPNSGAINYRLERYDLKPEQCYMVGDRNSDVECARGANCQSVLLGDAKEQANLNFNSLLEFAVYLQDLLANP